MTKRKSDNKRKVNPRKRTTTRRSSKRKKKIKINKKRVALAVLGLVAVIFIGGFLIKTVFNVTAKVWPNVVYMKEVLLGSGDKGDVDKVEQYDLNDENKEKVEKQKVVFIDIPRGANDKGYTTEDGVSEKDINLNVAQLIAQKLSKYGDVAVVLSRESDVSVTPDERKDAAKGSNAELFVSIGLAAESSKEATGVETIYNINSSPASADFAKVMQTSVAAHINTKNRGTNPYDVYILKDNEMPSVLVQYGFLSNEKEAKNLKSKKYQDQVAEGIAQGILAYIDAQKNK